MYYVVSDIHGCYNALREALGAAGFQMNNPKDIIISCGDNFDRGTQNTEVLDFLMGMHRAGRAILIMGNHEYSLQGILNDGCITTADVVNGTLATVAEFAGEKYKDNYKALLEDMANYNINFDKVFAFFSMCVKAVEFPSYVCVHGFVPTTAFKTISEEWQKASSADWEKAAWTDGIRAGLVDNMFIPNKKIVCGHKFAMLANLWKEFGVENYGSKRAQQMVWNSVAAAVESDVLMNKYNRVLETEHMVYIDGCAPSTNQVLVYKINEEILNIQY